MPTGGGWAPTLDLEAMIMQVLTPIQAGSRTNKQQMREKSLGTWGLGEIRKERR